MVNDSKSDDDVATWLKDNLSQLLSFPVPQDLIDYIMTIDNERDIEDYMKTLLDFNDAPHRLFCENYKVIRHFKNNEDSSKTKGESLSSMLDNLSVETPVKGESHGSGKKKKEKFVNLYSPEAAGKDVILLKGRHRCDCQAVKHNLVNNCLSCGRIVCVQEGSGPCFFCGELVCSKAEKEFINRKTAESEKLYDNLIKQGKASGSGWDEAVAHRDKLLEFDRTTQRRTKVIDDEGEYFSVGSVWLSPEERDKLALKEEEQRKRKHASRLSKKFTLDFAGRQVLPEDEQATFEEEEETEDPTTSRAYVNPNVNPNYQPEYTPTTQVQSGKKQQQSESITKKVKETGIAPRVQDRGLLEMTDSGACLSLHQPWASLVVHGIKKHEGRTWYSSHRGRLWIAAAAKEPTEADIREVEEFYRVLFPGKEFIFPKNYPTSCLLGCVTVVDCLSQEEYLVNFDVRESESPFVFICEDAQALSLKFPMSGQHKIYKLEKQIHFAAQKALFRRAKEDGA